VLCEEHVHALGAGDARQEIQRERRRAPCRQTPNGVAVLERLQDRDQDRPFAQQVGLLRGRRLDLHHDLRVRPDRRGVGRELRARGQVLLVGEVGRPASGALDPHLVALGDELLRRLGNERDAALAGGHFAGNADPHGAAP
jgi:hypothetical protein